MFTAELLMMRYDAICLFSISFYVYAIHAYTAPMLMRRCLILLMPRATRYAATPCRYATPPRRR